jgi:hypothetical protein
VKPFRIEINGYCETPIERWRENAAANAGYHRIERLSRHRRSLAIVGGGPSLADNLEDLRAFDGDIWAINDTSRWLTERGIACTLFTVDAQLKSGEARDAILATVCEPSLVASFTGRVLVFDTAETHADGFVGGTTSATRAPAIAFHMGYTQVSFFGCEGSFEERDHVDRHEANPSQLIIRAGERTYRTTLPFLVQSQELAKLMVFDGVFNNRSGGLFQALVEHPDTWEVVAVSAALKEHLERDGPTGIYDEPYQVNQRAA